MCSSDQLRDDASHPELHTDPDIIHPETEANLFHALPLMRALAILAAPNASDEKEKNFLVLKRVFLMDRTGKCTV